LFTVFKYYTVYHTKDENRHLPVVGLLTIPLLLLADHVAVGSFITNGLQGTDQIATFCKN
jgi:hypothetical protein